MKKYIIAAVTLSLSIIMCACASTDNNTTSVPEKKTKPTATSAETTETTETTASTEPEDTHKYVDSKQLTDKIIADDNYKEVKLFEKFDDKIVYYDSKGVYSTDKIGGKPNPIYVNDDDKRRINTVFYNPNSKILLFADYVKTKDTSFSDYDTDIIAVDTQSGKTCKVKSITGKTTQILGFYNRQLYIGILGFGADVYSLDPTTKKQKHIKDCLRVAGFMGNCLYASKYHSDVRNGPFYKINLDTLNTETIISSADVCENSLDNVLTAYSYNYDLKSKDLTRKDRAVYTINSYGGVVKSADLPNGANEVLMVYDNGNSAIVSVFDDKGGYKEGLYLFNLQSGVGEKIKGVKRKDLYGNAYVCGDNKYLVYDDQEVVDDEPTHRNTVYRIDGLSAVKCKLSDSSAFKSACKIVDDKYYIVKNDTLKEYKLTV